MWAIPVPVVEINSIESHDTHLFTSHNRLPLK
jgi:hypothetical protein